MSCAEMLNLILKMTQEVYFHWCWTDNKYGYKLLKMFLPKEGHEGDGEGVRQLEAREQISPDWRSRHGVAHRRGGWRTTVTASLGAGGVDTRTSGLGDRHCWNTAAWQGPAGGGALLSRMGWKRGEYDPGSKRPRTRNWRFTPGSWGGGGGAGEVAASFRWGTCLGEPFKPPG